MKAAKVLLGVVALAMVMTAFSLNASAETRTISPGGSFSVHAELNSNELVNTWFWSATGSLHFTLYDPQGTIIEESDSISDGGSLTPFASTAGQYTFTWENMGTTPVTLTYSVSFMGDLHEGLSMIALMAIIAAVVVVIVVIIIVVLVVMAAGKKKAAPMAPMGPMGQPVMMPVGGNCPQCGTPIPPEGMFCAKCGARIR